MHWQYSPLPFLNKEADRILYAMNAMVIRKGRKIARINLSLPMNARLPRALLFKDPYQGFPDGL